MACQDLVQVHCSLVRSVIEYAAPVCADLPVYLSKTLELIQKRAFNIIFPGLSYDVTLSPLGLLPLSQRREKSCQKLMQNFRDKGFLSNIISIPPETHHGYSLRSGSVVNSSVKVVAWTERMNNFCTYKYQ